MAKEQAHRSNVPQKDWTYSQDRLLKPLTLTLTVFSPASPTHTFEGNNKWSLTWTVNMWQDQLVNPFQIEKVEYLGLHVRTLHVSATSTIINSSPFPTQV